jgi:hypothetical protein
MDPLTIIGRMSRHAVAIAVGLGEQREASHPRALPDQVRYIDRGFASGGVAQRGQDTAKTKAA